LAKAVIVGAWTALVAETPEGVAFPAMDVDLNATAAQPQFGITADPKAVAMLPED
jgi:hypothetical protein